MTRATISATAALFGTVAASLIVWHCQKKKRSKKSVFNDDIKKNETVILHRFDPQEGSPHGDKSSSPFGIKVECFLRMCGMSHIAPPFSISALLSNPKRKLPTCEIDGTVAPDSSFVVKYLRNESKYAETCKKALCDNNLTPQQRAIGVAVKALCEDQLCFVLGYWRYKWEPGFQAYMSINTTVHSVPQPFRWILERVSKRGILKQLWEQGIGRHSLEEVDVIGKEAMDAIDALLADSPTRKFLFGEKPSSFDATLFATLSSTVEIAIKSPLKEYALEKEAIMSYIKLVNDLYWPVEGASG